MKFSYPEIEDIRGRESAEPEQPAPQMPLSEDESPHEQTDGWKRFATAVSWILVPLMLPVYGIILILTLSVLSYVNPGAKLAVILVILGLNALLPMLLVFLLKQFGIVQDIALNGRKERLIPYLISLSGYVLSALYLWNRGAPSWVWLLFTGGGITALINMIVNFRWKISAHAAAATGVVAMLFVIHIKGAPVCNMMPWIFGALVITGILGSCRIYLCRHTLMQVLAGYLSGFCPAFFLAYFLS